MRRIAIAFLLACATLAAPTAARAATSNTATLTEFRTPDGWYYATDPSEIAAAQRQYALTERRDVAEVHNGYSAGAVPIYRLKTTARREYLLTTSSGEVTALLDSGHFQYERILGYISRSPAAGRQELDRMNNGQTWRVTTASGRAALTAAGFTLDGPLGYAG
ncbi:MAG TPA: hypothetical protein VHC49_20585 [Mycobacteriales bacterium]|nr:hypothetical protein [Mycobacteriales bacterium]